MRRIGGNAPKPVDDMVISTRACKGSPDTIQPGAVVAMARALEWCVEQIENEDDDLKCLDNNSAHAGRTALAMYYGEK